MIIQSVKSLMADQNQSTRRLITGALTAVTFIVLVASGFKLRHFVLYVL